MNVDAHIEMGEQGVRFVPKVQKAEIAEKFANLTVKRVQFQPFKAELVIGKTKNELIVKAENMNST